MGLMFEVAEGGFLDIDVRIEGKFFTSTVFLFKPLLFHIFRLYKQNLQVQTERLFIRANERVMENIPLRHTWMANTSIASVIRCLQ